MTNVQNYKELLKRQSLIFLQIHFLVFNENGKNATITERKEGKKERKEKKKTKKEGGRGRPRRKWVPKSHQPL
jgi:hypothetical protein